MAKRMTKRDYFTILRNSYPTDASNYDEVVKFIDHEIELLDKKNSADKKPTKQQEANAELKEVILEVLSGSGTAMTITEIQKADARLSECANQRISALVRQMLGDSVKRTEDKHKAYFSAI